MDKSKEIFLKNLGQRITRLRESKGISQTELALQCDKDRQSINRLEKGNVNPSIFYLKQIADALEIPTMELLNF